MKDPYINDISILQNVPYQNLPFLIFGTSFTGLFSYLIRLKTHGTYSHFMWMHEPGMFASQNLYFKSVPVAKYSNCKLKIVYNPNWSSSKRAMLLERIYSELEKKKWKTRYDWLNIIGQLFNFKILQNPFTRICSETADFLKLIDPNYTLCNPTPDEIVKWVNQNPEYELFARYSPD